MRGKAPYRLRHRAPEAGYALMLMLFFLALLVLSTVAIAPTVISNVQREKEAEMVWRGKQYRRAVRLYYQKLHRFPTALDDLYKAKTGIRFLRQPYKDPMNQEDGSWRLIYVGPNGQLIGSLKPQNTPILGLGGGAATGALTSNAANPALGSNPNSSSLFGGSALPGTNSAGLNFNNANAPMASSPAGATPVAGTALTGAAAGQNGPNDYPENPQPLGMMDSSNVIGGNIIGVGSKVNKPSFLWYDKAKNYRLFEFIWDPAKDQMGTGRASSGIGTPVQNMQGTNPMGGAAGVSPPGSTPGPAPTQNLGDPAQTLPLTAPPNNP